MSWLLRMCAETEKQKEKGCGVRSMDVIRYATPLQAKINLQLERLQRYYYR